MVLFKPEITTIKTILKIILDFQCCIISIDINIRFKYIQMQVIDIDREHDGTKNSLIREEHHKIQ